MEKVVYSPNDIGHPEVSQKQLGNCTYDDWYDCTLHNLKSSMPVKNENHDVKDINIRLMLKQLNELNNNMQVNIDNVQNEIE